MTDATSILEQLSQIQAAALEELPGVKNEAGLLAWKAAHLGRSSPVMQAFSKLPAGAQGSAPGGRPARQPGQAGAGSRLLPPAVRRSKKRPLSQHSAARRTTGCDPAGPRPGAGAAAPGDAHPARSLPAVLAEMGFQVYRSPDVETDEYNFGLLNIPPYHPARDMWDTFHTTTPGVVLRTHTSPGQIHAMRELCSRTHPGDLAGDVLPL